MNPLPIIALLGAVVLVLALAELLVRLFVHWKPRGIDPWTYRLAEPPELGFEFTPENTFCHHYRPPRVQGGPWKQCYQINALGIRDRLYPPRPPDNTVRIVCVGDSCTFGEGVEEHQSWPRQLETMLRSDPGEAGPAVEVINCGVAGYDLEKKLAHYRKKCLGLHPHIAILGYTLNDPQRLLAPLINGDGMLSSGSVPPWSGFRQLVKTRSALANWAAHRWSELFGAQRLLPTYGSRSPDWIRSRAQLKEFSILSLEQGIRPLVAILPAPFRLHRGHPYLPIYRIMESFLDEEGIAWANLFPSIEGQKKREMIVCSCDFHSSARCYELFAAGLHRELTGRSPFRDLLRV